MFASKMPEVKILNEPDVSGFKWCGGAITFSVKNGKGSLSHIISGETENYEYSARLVLNNKPLIQGEYSISPTCSGLLATGYGIENIDCPELKNVREKINSAYKDIRSSAEALKPLLGLLDDGIYLLADIEYNPTDGSGNFFYSVPNEPTPTDAVCDTYFNINFDPVNAFPAYLYPTQSAALCNPQRVEEYVRLLKDNPKPPRGIAYYEKGFISALIDGHHKACAAARLGIKLNCLTIMRADRVEYSGLIYRGKNSRVKNVFFAGIKLPAEKGARLGDYGFNCKYPRGSKHKLHEYSLTGRRFPHEELSAAKNYFTLDQLCGISAFGFDVNAITDDEISALLEFSDEENCCKLKYMLAYFTVNDKNRAYELAKKIILSRCDRLPRREAWQAMLDFKTDETEQMVIDYFVEHDKKDSCWDIVNSYWN